MLGTSLRKSQKGGIGSTGGAAADQFSPYVYDGTVQNYGRLYIEQADRESIDCTILSGGPGGRPDVVY